MSTVIMSACWPLQGMSPAQKAVLISLADNANDEGVCWPSIARISERTCLSERSVQNAIKWLSAAKIVTVHERPGRSSYFTLTPAAYAPPQDVHPAADAPPPPQQVRTTPAGDAPRTVIEPKSEPPVGEKRSRGSRLPVDWTPSEELKAWALTERPDWDDVQLEAVADAFRDYWVAKTGSTATKMDWSATWRNWVRNERRSYGNQPGSKQRPGGMSRQAAIEERNRQAAEEFVNGGNWQ